MNRQTHLTMKKILIATTNPNKVTRIKNLLRDMDFNLISLADLDYKIPEPEENQENAQAIALHKAKWYWKHLKEKMPVITQDDTLIIQGFPKGTFKNLKPLVEAFFGDTTDESMIEYYATISRKHGGKVPSYFEYGHGYCDGSHSKSQTSTLSFILVDEPKLDSTQGYPIVALMKVITGDGELKYYVDLTEEEKIELDVSLKQSLNELLLDLNA